jgi:hypothetical protein
MLRGKLIGAGAFVRLTPSGPMFYPFYNNRKQWKCFIKGAPNERKGLIFAGVRSVSCK